MATKLLFALRPPAGLAAAAAELSPTSYLGPRAIPNLFRGGRLTSGLSSLRLAKGSNNGGNEVGADVGMGGGVSGLVGESMKGGGNGEGGDSRKGIRGGDEDHGDSGDA
ncbi:hypothetical protein Tco_1179490, partial [Tanacetum coccineum]